MINFGLSLFKSQTIKFRFLHTHTSIYMAPEDYLKSNLWLSAETKWPTELVTQQLKANDHQNLLFTLLHYSLQTQWQSRPALSRDLFFKELAHLSQEHKSLFFQHVSGRFSSSLQDGQHSSSGARPNNGCATAIRACAQVTVSACVHLWTSEGARSGVQRSTAVGKKRDETVRANAGSHRETAHDEIAHVCVCSSE